MNGFPYVGALPRLARADAPEAEVIVADSTDEATRAERPERLARR